MNLYILRHASAGVARVNPLLDLKRPLDREGKQHCLQLALVLSALKVQFDLIVSSPLKRALQTASLVGTEVGCETPIVHSAALAPLATYAEFKQLLLDCHASENVLVVGHNPNLTGFLGNLLVSNTDAGASVRLRKGSLARVNLARGPAVLQWLLDPRTVRAMYSTSIKSSRLKRPRSKPSRK